METEKIRIYDEHGKEQGVATRQAVHEHGYWHETFHCWVISRQGSKNLIHLQLRSEEKKDFPGLFDITAAGHLLADEATEDGIREVSEELGLEVSFEELTSLDMVKDQLELEGFIDNERCHCFLYRAPENVNDTYKLQQEEVAGMARIDFESFANLITGKEKEAEVEGFVMDSDGSKQAFRKTIGLKDLVPHSPAYFEQVAYLIRQELAK